MRRSSKWLEAPEDDTPADRYMDVFGVRHFCVLGPGCRGRPRVLVYRGDRNRLRAGANVTFGEDVDIFVGGNHRTDWVATFGIREVFDLPGAFVDNPWSKGDVVIGNDAVIGRGVKIFSGVTVGEGAMVRPYSIVVGDVAPHTAVQGCPAREVGGSESPAAASAAIATDVAGHGDEGRPVSHVKGSLRSRAATLLRRVSYRLEPDGGVPAAAIPGGDPAAPDDARLTMGTASYFTPTIHGGAAGGHVTIGSYCSIAYEVEMLLEASSIRTGAVAAAAPRLVGHPAAPDEPEAPAEIVVGSDVWLGRGSKLVSGVTIGDGAVVAAYSVVTTDVRPYAIVAGNPAREIGRRFDDDVVDALLQIKWWEWPVGTVRDRANHLCTDDVRAFVARYAIKPE